ncbi:MAG TPA: hypothetical protein VIR27_10300 [Mycobacteriales bacterium]
MTAPLARSDRHCRRKDCRCLHDGCMRGWVDVFDESGKEWATPCPVCRWDRQARDGEDREDWLARLRDQDGAWSRRLGGAA